jgi:hypothetical protein
MGAGTVHQRTAMVAFEIVLVIVCVVSAAIAAAGFLRGGEAL